MKGWVKGIIAGVIIAVIGVVVLIIGLSLNGWKYAYSLPDFETGTYYEKKENTDFQVEINAGRIRAEFYNGNKIRIDYPYAEEYEPTIAEESGTLIFKTPEIKWHKFNRFGSCIAEQFPLTRIYIPQNNACNLQIKVNAGTVEFVGSGTCGNVEVKLNAGTLKIGPLICDDFDCQVNAGTVNIAGLQCKVLKSEVNAGTCKIQDVVCGDITTKVSAGSLKLTVDAKKSEYSIIVDKKAGSCNVSGQIGTASKILRVYISAGSANVTFTGD